MRVAVDLEDVIVDTNEYFVQRLNYFLEKNYPDSDVKVRKGQIRGWRFDGLRQTLAEIMGWEGETIEKFMHGDGNGWDGYFEFTERIWRQETGEIPLTEQDVEDNLRKLREVVKKDGELSLVTARENVNGSIETKLRENSLLDIFDNVIVEKEKQKLGFDFYIDDFPHLFKNLETNQIQFMVAQPWNRDIRLEEPHRRVKGIADSVEVIKDVER